MLIRLISPLLSDDQELKKKEKLRNDIEKLISLIDVYRYNGSIKDDDITHLVYIPTEIFHPDRSKVPTSYGGIVIAEKLPNNLTHDEQKQYEQNLIWRANVAKVVVSGSYTKLGSLVTERRLRKESQQAALAAIMARDLSHNFGSHILAAGDLLKHPYGSMFEVGHPLFLDISEPDEEGEQRLANVKSIGGGSVFFDLPENCSGHTASLRYGKEPPGIEGKMKTDGYIDPYVPESEVRKLHNYLQQRMDFIAQVISSKPSWQLPLRWFSSLLNGIFQQYLYLTNLVADVKFSHKLKCPTRWGRTPKCDNTQKNIIFHVGFREWRDGGTADVAWYSYAPRLTHLRDENGEITGHAWGWDLVPKTDLKSRAEQVSTVGKGRLIENSWEDELPAEWLTVDKFVEENPERCKTAIEAASIPKDFLVGIPGGNIGKQALYAIMV